jgi:DNA polymerase IV
LIEKIIFHIDMDAFFASCEEALNPSLKGKPLIVGGTKKDLRSIVTCPNYLARAKGIRTAMPLTQALALAPEGNFIRCTKGIYSDYSKRVREILFNYTPVVEPASIDEAYLEVSGVLHSHKNDPVYLAQKIKDEIKDKLKITCSVGISRKKVCSKIASKQNKPDGITLVPFGKEKEFLAPLPVQRIPGVGKATLIKLTKYGVKTIGDLLKFDKSFFENEIGIYSSYLYKVANGEDNRDVHSESEGHQKSLSKENTFYEDTNDLVFLKKELYSLLEKACARLRKYKITGKTLTVKVKYSDFTVNQKSFTRTRYSNLEMDFYEDALALMKSLLGKSRKIRLLGVRFNEFLDEDGAVQENLFYDEEKFKNIAVNLDKIRKKYNFGIIKFGKNFESES